MKRPATKNATARQGMRDAKKKPPEQFTHGGLKSRILLKLSELPGTMVFNAPTGVGLSLDGKRKLAFGKKGLADIIGICGGIGIAVEVKVGKDELSDEQIKFRKNWKRCGGVFVEARSVDQCLADLRAGITRAEMQLADRLAREGTDMAALDFESVPE